MGKAKFNGTLWKAILLALKSRTLKVEQWEVMLIDGFTFNTISLMHVNQRHTAWYMFHPSPSISQ